MKLLVSPILIILGFFQGLEGQKNCPLRPRPVPSSEMLTQLRAELSKLLSNRNANLEAFIITSDDEHQNEFVADHDKRLEFISGFKGNRGEAVVTKTKAALWVEPDDYWLADSQVDCDWIIYRLGNDQDLQLTEWLRKEVRTGVRVAADPKLVPAYKWEEWRRDLEINHIALMETSSNPIDDIWKQGRPQYINSSLYFISGGKTREAKLEALRGNLTRLDCQAMIVTALDEIAWLLNVRGQHSQYTPFIRSYLIVTKGEAYWFVPSDQRTDQIIREIDKQGISRIKIERYDNFWTYLRSNANNWRRILIPARCEFAAGASQAISGAILPNRRVIRQSPIIYLKAEKNQKEIEGMHAASLRDSAAVIDFLSFIEEELEKGGNFTETFLAQKLQEYQQNQTNYRSPATPIRVVFGAHASMRNFKPTNETDEFVDSTSTLVVQTAQHYLDGTTSLARTVHYGVPSLTEIRLYSFTLASLIELSRQIFPANIRTSELDIFARSQLWKEGFSYNHSSGHGIGAFSSLHEPPININRNSLSQMQNLQRGYFITIGPSLNKPGKFGVSLENVVEVLSKNSKPGYLLFKEATLVPYETKLIEPSLLSVEQVQYINEYHSRVLQEVGAELKRQSKMRGFYWLMQKTKTITPYCNSSNDGFPVSLMAMICLFSVRYFL